MELANKIFPVCQFEAEPRGPNQRGESTLFSVLVLQIRKAKQPVPQHMKYQIESNEPKIELWPPLSDTVHVRGGQASLSNHSFPAQAPVQLAPSSS